MLGCFGLPVAAHATSLPAKYRGLRIEGVKTTIPYYQEILKHPDFRNANFNTSFVESHPELIDYVTTIPPELRAAAIAAVIAAHEGI